MVAIDGDVSRFLRTLDEKHILPAVSPIVPALVKLAAKDETSARQIADLIAKDPALTTRMLKLANSAFYRTLYPAATVLQAVTRIGVRQTRLFALSVSLKDAFHIKRGGPIDYRRFWRLCLYQGLLARWLASTLRLGDPEEAFTAGLTLEIGLLVLARAFAHDRSLNLDGPVAALLAAEKERYGIQHRQIGEALLRSWGFPERIVGCQWSFAFKEGLVPSSEPARVCAVAGELSAFMCQPRARIHDVFDTVETFFGLSKGMVTEAVGTALEEVNEIAETFGVEVDSTKDAIELMEKANQALVSLAKETLDGAPRESLPSFDTLPQMSHSKDAVRHTLEAVAHEVRNPLTAVGGFVRRLAKTIDPESREGTYVRVIMAETDRLEQALGGMKRILASA